MIRRRIFEDELITVLARRTAARDATISIATYMGLHKMVAALPNGAQYCPALK